MMHGEPEFQPIVDRIEEAHPELNALLRTAIEQTPESDDASLTFLQERVVQEAIDHAVAHQWIRLVPNQALERGARALLLAKVACGIALLSLLQTTFRTAPSTVVQNIVPPQPANIYSVEVTPGNIEIERGDRLIVLARFDRNIPGEAVLMTGSAPDVLEPTPMKKISTTRFMAGSSRR